MNFIKGSGSVFLLGGCTSVDLFSYLLDIFLKRVDWLSKRRKKTWRPLCTIGLVFTYVISLLRRYYEGWSWKDRTISRYLERLLLLVLKDIAQAIHSTNTGQCFLKLLVSKFALFNINIFYEKFTIQDIYELTQSKQISSQMYPNLFYWIFWSSSLRSATLIAVQCSKDVFAHILSSIYLSK